MNRIAGLEAAGTVAPALVLQCDAKDVWQDLTPVKQQMRVPGLVWGGIAMETALAKKRRVSLRFIQPGKVRTAWRIGCPFESTSTLQLAERLDSQTKVVSHHD